MSLSTTRRQFLQTTLGSSALLSAHFAVPSFLARSARALEADKSNSGEKVLVVVQLSGGNDGLNTVIPFTDPAYNKNRIVLRIAKEQVLKINGELGFHPQMTGFGGLLEDKRLCVVQGVGYPNPNRSHFESMDIWHSCHNLADKDADAGPRTGWLGRTLDAAERQAGDDVPALHLGANELPLALIGRETPVPSIRSVDTFRLRTEGGAVPQDALRKLVGTKRPDSARQDSAPLLDFVRRSTLSALDSSQKVQDSLRDDKSPVKYPGFGLAEKLQTIARLIDAGLSTKIYYVSLDGFDTHAKQGEAHGALLNELASSVKAFCDDLAHRGHLDRTLVMSFSEFGRRVRENASLGTDHGAAAPMFLAGGGVKPGVIGKHPSLTRLDEGDMFFHTDFRQVYGEVLDQWLGGDSTTVLAKKYEPVGALTT